MIVVNGVAVGNVHHIYRLIDSGPINEFPQLIIAALSDIKLDSWTAVFDSVKLQKVDDVFVPKGGAFTLTIEKTDGNTTVLNYEYKISNTQLNPDFDALGAFKIDIPNGLPVFHREYENLWIAYGAPSVLKFDPTQGQTLTVEYWVNIDANAVVTVADAGDPNDIIRTISQAATVGRNQWIWDGQDVNSLIVEDGFYDFGVDVNDGVDTAYYDCGTGELDYLHAITNVNSNPYRFIATNNEITTITYDLTVDANMVVSIYDPNGLLFRTLTAPQTDPNEVVWDGRNKDASQSDSRYIIKDGPYGIEVRYEGMREKEEGIVTVYK